MKKLAIAILIIAIMPGLVSCKKDLIGKGPVTTETRSVTNFTGIDLRMNGNVYYKNDSVWKVEVSAKQTIHPILQTYVAGNKLVIKYADGKTYDADETIRINVSGPGVNAFELNTSGSIYCENSIQASSLYLRTTGSGSIWLQNVTASTIDAASTVSGTISGTGGSINNAILKTDGSGKIEIQAIAANTVTARTTGSGDIRVKVAHYLDATIDGSGDIYFSGYPSLSTHINGSGRLVRF
ncbi:MAG: head GIN domain-containing protein [Ferruginibacter sp.]